MQHGLQSVLHRRWRRTGIFEELSISLDYSLSSPNLQTSHPDCFVSRTKNKARKIEMHQNVVETSLAKTAPQTKWQHSYLQCPIPLLGSSMISSLHQSSGMVSTFQILWNRSYNQSVAKRISVFNTSTMMFSVYSRCLVALQTLHRFQNHIIVGGEQSISSLSPKG